MSKEKPLTPGQLKALVDTLQGRQPVNALTGFRLTDLGLMTSEQRVSDVKVNFQTGNQRTTVKPYYKLTAAGKKIAEAARKNA